MAKLDVILEKLSSMEKKMEKIDKSLHGNGRPGLIDEFNEWKGAVKIAGFILSLMATSGILLAIF